MDIPKEERLQKDPDKFREGAPHGDALNLFFFAKARNLLGTTFKLGLTSPDFSCLSIPMITASAAPKSLKREKDTKNY